MSKEEEIKNAIEIIKKYDVPVLSLDYLERDAVMNAYDVLHKHSIDPITLS